MKSTRWKMNVISFEEYISISSTFRYDCCSSKLACSNDSPTFPKRNQIKKIIQMNICENIYTSAKTDIKLPLRNHTRFEYDFSLLFHIEKSKHLFAFRKINETNVMALTFSHHTHLWAYTFSEIWMVLKILECKSYTKYIRKKR